MLEEKKYESLDLNYYKLMVIKRVCIGVLFLGAFVGYYFLKQPYWLTLSLFVIISIGILVVVGAMILLAKLFFNRKLYAIHDKNVSYKKGVLIHSNTIVPFSRIQHIEIDEGPLERYFKLASISIYTAGDSGKDLKISGLEVVKANEIKEFITSFIKDE